MMGIAQLRVRILGIVCVLSMTIGERSSAQIMAGAAAVDVTPIALPVIVNGGFTERIVNDISDPLYARSLVLSDGTQTVSITVVDACMIPRDVCDRIKQLAATSTRLQASRMLVAATHTHSAPSVMDYCLGSRRDDGYTEHLIPLVAQSITAAHADLQPAVAGWTVTAAPAHTYCRRWIRRPDRVDHDPFGELTVRAMMHPGFENADYLGPAGPVDAGLSMLSLRSPSGAPICVLANYSMHYVGGVTGISADYWGHFARSLSQRISESPAAANPADNLVVMMSQGTSGDLHWMDYSQPKQTTSVEAYAEQLAAIAHQAYESIEYRSNLQLAMAQQSLTLRRRLPDSARLAWATELNARRGDRRPQDRPEVYAEQATWIQEHPQEEILLQAIRLGPLGIVAIPNEVFGVTGLKIKAQSPLATSFTIELANGAAGYIPPPEQHRLGGYTTWPARTAGLEVDAEPKIVEAVLTLLEQVAEQPRRDAVDDFYSPTMRANMRQALEGTDALAD